LLPPSSATLKLQAEQQADNSVTGTFSAAPLPAFFHALPLPRPFRHGHIVFLDVCARVWFLVHLLPDAPAAVQTCRAVQAFCLGFRAHAVRAEALERVTSRPHLRLPARKRRLPWSKRFAWVFEPMRCGENRFGA